MEVDEIMGRSITKILQDGFTFQKQNHLGLSLSAERMVLDGWAEMTLVFANAPGWSKMFKAQGRNHGIQGLFC
jgi:hypothetical protein